MELLGKQILAWAEQQPAWQRDLLRRVSRGPLDDAGRQEVADIVTDAANAPAPVSLSAADLAVHSAASEPIALVAIRDVQGVNALASDQNLRFEPTGLNVVFGANGSGKSGLGRILRKACRAVAVPKLHPDAFSDVEVRQTARLKVRRGDQELDLRLNLNDEAPQWLSAIKVFDAECAQEYVRNGNAVEHTPEPLGILSRCADEQTAIAATLRERAAALKVTLPPLPSITSPSAAAAAAATIEAGTDLESLISGSGLSDAERQRLEQLEDQLRALERNDLEETVRTTRAASDAAATLATILDQNAAGLSDQVAEDLDGLRSRLTSAKADLDRLRGEALAGQPIAGTGTTEWRAMWEAARAFIVAESDVRFPAVAPDPCPLCQRPVDADTAARLARFEAFVTSDLERRVAEAVRSLRQAVGSLPDPERAQLTSASELAMLDPDLRDAVVAALGALNARRGALAEGLETSGVDVADVVRHLRERSATQAEQAAKHEALRRPEQVETLKNEIAELRGRRDLVEGAGALRAYQRVLVEVQRLIDAADDLDTSSITRRHNQLAKLAISDRLVKAVQRELDAFGSLAGCVEASASGSKGRTVLRVRLKGATTKPGVVLSEGEHRAVAIAFFLAQLTEGNALSPIVFDDPVSSLDHLWRDEIVMRLVEEAAKRQVVIFTHDLAFLAHLAAEAGNANVSMTQRHLTRDTRGAGIVSNAPPFERVSLPHRAAELRTRVERNLEPLWQHNRDEYNVRAAAWMVDLRKSWELLVEEGLLRGVVRRYDLRVYTNKLKNINIPDGAVDRICAAFGRMSAKAHHEAAALQGTVPSPKRLLERLAEFEAVIKELGVESAQTTADAGEAAA